MSKIKTKYICQQCGLETVKWLGKCPGCGEWNSLVEELIPQEPFLKGGLALGLSSGQKPEQINKVETDEYPRFSTGSEELNRVLGLGIMPGSLTLIVGDPGIGKSSLTLQVCSFVAENRGKVLYVTGEESARQIRQRADRLKALNENLFVLSETNLEIIEKYTLELKPELLIIDSIQTIFKPDIQSAPGSVSQVRESAAQLLRLAKTNVIATFLVGHVTKDGTLAGPRVLEHIVDTVLYFEGDRNAQFRVLRAIKNRFGSTNEIGLFEMCNQGLVDVPDASKIFLAERPVDVPGSVIIPTIEGTRPLLVEAQALVSKSTYLPPRRTSDSVDIKRIQLLLAVLEKRVGLGFGNMDVFVKVAGRITIDEPAIDLGLTVALASSLKNVATDKATVIFGEVGLTGEVRAVTQVEQRIKESEKMGFRRIILPNGNLNNLSPNISLELVGVKSVEEGLQAAFK
ncbi:DNA repair protein RadA [Bacillota bacterium LX-D]|nr:DNA repair protein RadA [Bacillota bacterium LX-D]